MGDNVFRQDFGDLGGFLGGLAQKGASPELAMIENEQYTDRVISAIEDGFLSLNKVPDVVSNEEYFAKMTETLKSLGIDPEQYTKLGQIEDLTTNTTANDLVGGVDMLDPEVTGLGGNENIVTDDERYAQWEDVDKEKDIKSLLQDALDIFGLGNLNKGIVNVADVINDRNISVQDVAAASGNTVEYVNDAFEKAGVKINNQGETPTEQPPESPNNNGGALENTGGGTTETVGDRQVGDGLIVPKRDVVVDDRPKTILPTLPIPEPKQTMNLTLMQSIVNDTPVTESILFPTKFTKLENVQQGMFGEFLRAAGGRR
jgi:hypothetical protein